MKVLTFCILLLGVLLTLAFGNNLKDGLPQPLKFEHTRFSFPIKETHGIGSTRMRLTAHGCGDEGIKYTIQEKDVPFFIHPHTGRISLNKRLNYTEKALHSFIVEAVAKNKQCKFAKALTLVNVNVLQFNRYRPQFMADKYYCSIQEETGHVKVSPEIKVFDKDSGSAGKIAQVQIWETEQPFVLELDESTGVVTVSGTPGYKFDATRMPSYKMSLQAWDHGDPPRNSPPVKLHCKVIPQNRHAPVFRENMYVGRVKQGEVNPNIVKVQAKDRDTFEKFGDICEYFIRTSDMPFEINNKGVISLTKPLGNDAPDTYVFTVMAKDCGGKISEEATTVNVIVDKDCTPGFVELENRSPELKDCDGMVRLTPDIRLNTCGESRQYANFSTRIHMETAHIMKGCDRETYEASGVFKLCNVNKTLDLLPSNYRENTWIAGMMRDENILGKDVYHFDNKTAIDVPFSLMEKYTGDESMTISVWVWMKKQDRTQYILAATDPQRLDRKHFGLYTEGDKLVFIHRREATASSEDVCKSVFVWKPEIFNTQWHHVLVTVNGCQRAKLFVDSKKVTVSNMKENWPLHGSNMAKRVVIGARWLGREQKYEDHFDGFLAGLSVNFGEHIDKKAIDCVHECKERIKIGTPTPSGFQVIQNDHKCIEINGQGSPTTLENILRSLVYVNTRRSPTNGRRPLQIQTTINNQPLPMLNLEVAVSTSEKTLTLSGASRKVVALNDLKKYGIRIAEKLTITSDKCTTYLDSARVEVDPPLGSDESLVNPGPMLDLLNLRKDNLPGGKGLVIRGLATLEDYKMVLREIVFVHLGLEDLNNPATVVHHKFKFTVSNLQNRYTSNTLLTELTTDQKRPQYDMQAIGRQEKDSLPGEVEEPTGEPDGDGPVGKKSPGSLSVTIGVIVAASCVFVFAILVVVIRMQRTRNVYLDVSQKEDETAVQDDGVEPKQMNVTLNPLEKFETVVNKTGSQEASNQPGGKTLEWDDAYIA